MSTATEKLLVGSPLIYLAPTGTTEPELDDLPPPDITIATPSAPWVEVGESEEDFVLEYTPTFEFKKTNQYTSNRVAALTDEDVTVTFTLSGADMAAYQRAMNASSNDATPAGADQVAKDVLTVGGRALAEKAILVIGTSPEGGSRILTCWRAIQTGSATITNQKGVWVGTEVEFTLLGDDTQSAGEELFKYVDITAQASS
jgi:hypothetical protein